MLAINTDEEPIVDRPEIASTIVENREIVAIAKNNVPPSLPVDHVNDEVDTFLKDLAQEDNAQTLVIDEDGYVSIQAEAPITIQPAPVSSHPPIPTQSELADGTRYVDVTVKRGDALEVIARSNGTTVDAIKKANNLSSTKLSVGQVLRVPVSTTKKVVADAGTTGQPKQVTASTTNSSSGAQYYVVKKGDNPWKIAKQFNVRFEDLLKMNNLDEERARNMKIGDKIRVK